jgi:calreticulin
MKIPTITAILGLAALASAEVFFHETFSDGEGWKDRWTPSTYREDLGKLEVAPGKWFADEKAATGLRTTEDYRFYAISSKTKSFSNKDKNLVIQFDVKNEQDIDCGGSYFKVKQGEREKNEFIYNSCTFSFSIMTLTPRTSMVILLTTSCLALISVVLRLWYMLF